MVFEIVAHIQKWIVNTQERKHVIFIDFETAAKLVIISPNYYTFFVFCFTFFDFIGIVCPLSCFLCVSVFVVPLPFFDISQCRCKWIKHFVKLNRKLLHTELTVSQWHSLKSNSFLCGAKDGEWQFAIDFSDIVVRFFQRNLPLLHITINVVTPFFV